MGQRIKEMNNVTEKIEKVYSLNDELQTLLEEESAEYKKVLDRKNDIHMVSRGSSAVEVTKGELLEDVRVSGSKEATELLKKDFPRLFEVAAEREQKNTELHDYVQEQFGFSFRHMGIADYIKLTESVIKYHNEQKSNN